MNRTTSIARLTIATSIAALLALGTFAAERSAAHAQSDANTSTAASVWADSAIEINADGLDRSGAVDGMASGMLRNGVRISGLSISVGGNDAGRNNVGLDVVILRQQ